MYPFPPTGRTLKKRSTLGNAEHDESDEGCSDAPEERDSKNNLLTPVVNVIVKKEARDTVTVQQHQQHDLVTQANVKKELVTG